MDNSLTQKSGREYKDTLFRTLFSDSKRFLELYNAVANEQLPDTTLVTTFESNEILAKYNDLAACIDNQLIIFFEHQSTLSANMPLRLLSYITDILYLHVLDRNKLYNTAQVKIPAPKFYILYNGKQKLTINKIKLSDAFLVQNVNPSMELIAEIININLGSGDNSLNRSLTLQGYAYLIEEIRKNQSNGMSRDIAIVTAIDLCINTGVLSDFLTEHYLEVSMMLNWEYDAEAEKRVLRESALEEGIQQGKQETIEQFNELLKEGLSLSDALEKINQ
ncbi:MAG: hypothetical protein FWD38_01100 [Oscillospiraceae bacterium]|nr:hypothetical protein [Oscillospiraceae bacterium]